jgi:hypothetical protein
MIDIASDMIILKINLKIINLYVLFIVIEKIDLST